MSAEETVQESQSEMQPVNIDFNPFKEGGLTEEAPTPEKVDGTLAAPKEKTEAEVPATVPAVDYNLYLKEKFGYDSEEVAITEIKRLKEARAAEEIKFANDDSKRVFEYLKDGKEEEVFNLLSEKKKIDKLLSIKPEELKVENALDIIKMDMAVKYPTLRPEQIESRVNRQYAMPAMPKQQLDETDDEYEEVLNEWKATKEAIENDIIIDGTIAIPTLQNRKIELKLPDIQKQIEAPAAQSQEDSDKQAKIDEDFALAVPNTVKEFNGVKVTTTVQYGDVELPVNVSYAPSDSERKVLEAGLKDGSYLAKRWFDEQGVPSATKIADDIFFLDNKAAILQKVATESATQAVKEFLNKRANVKLDDSKGGAPSLTDKNAEDDMARYFLRAS